MVPLFTPFLRVSRFCISSHRIRAECLSAERCPAITKAPTRPASRGNRQFRVLWGSMPLAIILMGTLVRVPYSTLFEYIPVAATIVTTILSVVLARATLRYAKAADRGLELSREQFEREWAPELHVRLERASTADARIVLTNLARAAVLLQLVQLRTMTHAVPFERQYLNDPLVGGNTWTQHIGDRILAITGNDFEGTIAASVSFYAT